MNTNDWIRRGAPLAAFALCLGVASAQDGRPAEAAMIETPSERLASLEKEYGAWRNEYFAALREANRSGDATKVGVEDRGEEFLARFAELAESVPGTDAAAEAWINAMQVGLQFELFEGAGRAFDELAEGYGGYGGLAQAIPMVRMYAERLGPRRVEDALGRLLAESPLEQVRASAIFTLARVLGEGGSEDELAEASGLLLMLRDEYGDTLSPFGQGAYAELAERNLYELNHLQVGMVAPEVESVDATGAAFKLSDYRGKVVLVDFWGFW